MERGGIHQPLFPVFLPLSIAVVIFLYLDQ